VFERFTDRARRVLVLAQEEARVLEHGRIGTEHVLLGLLHEGTGVAAVALYHSRNTPGTAASPWPATPTSPSAWSSSTATCASARWGSPPRSRPRPVVAEGVVALADGLAKADLLGSRHEVEALLGVAGDPVEE
jgi:hypothetical protein